MVKLNQSRILFKLAAAVLLLTSSGAWAQTETLVVAYSKQGLDLTQYQQFHLLPLNLTGTRIVPPPWVENPDPHEWGLTQENKDFLVSAYASSVRAGIGETGQFKVVDEPAAGTLQLEVRLMSLTPWASRLEKDVETLGSGTLTFEAYVRDARTGELLTIYQGTQLVGKDYQENTALNKQAGLTEHFTNWGRNISRRLAEARAK